jgi:hypothetical protein
VSINIIVAIAGVCLIDLCYIYPYRLFLELQYFPSLTLSQKIQISAEDVKLASRELNEFIVSKCFMAPESPSRKMLSLYKYLD